MKLSVSDPDAPDADPEDPSGDVAARLERFYREHTGRFWLAVTVGPVALVVLGVIVAPAVVWDGFLWRYLWGPIAADAQGGCVTDFGVRACPGYSFPSYLVYGPTLGLAILGLTDFLKRFEIDVDGRFMLALAPTIVFGSMLRVMEDTALFDPPVQYAMISPLIYFTIAVIAVGSLALGVLAERVRRRSGVPAALTVVAVPTLAFLVGYVAVELTPAWAAAFAFIPPPPVVFGSTLLAFGLVAVDTWGRDRVDPLVVAFGVGLVGLLLVLYNSAWWIAGEPWSQVGIGRTFVDTVLPATLAGTLLITGAVTAVFWVLHRRGVPRTGIFLSGIAVAMLFGHALDAWATTIALKNPFGFPLAAYAEKHPASNFLLVEFGWPVWVAVKVALALAIVWMLEVEYEDDLADRPHLVGLLQLAIIVLGLGPGIRDVGRVTLGV